MTGFELIDEPEPEKKLIEGMIQRFGSNPEHNFAYFLAQAEEADEKCVFVRNGRHGAQMVHSAKNKRWRLIGTPIAPQSEQPHFVLEMLDFLAGKGKLGKVVAEFERNAKKKVDEALARRYKVHSPSCVLYWPVFDMKAWTGDKLEGREWKKVRNILNRVRKSHKITMADSAGIKKASSRSL